MRILTINWHEAYICTLAKTGHRFDVVERLKGGREVWFYETRPLPPNAVIVPEAAARRRLRERRYDLAIAHNIRDLEWLGEYRVPVVLVLHNKLTTEIALGGHTVAADDHRARLAGLLRRIPWLRLVFISRAKQEDWGFEGDIILPGVDLDDYGGYEGSERRVLRVGNFMRQRDLMLGYSLQRQAIEGLPSTLLGLNEGDHDSRYTRSWDDLKACFRSHRVYLSTTIDGYEDGYNLAMLEAMATGMPIVSSANRSSPITDGVNGFVSDDPARLHDALLVLLEDRALAARLGAAARRTVAESFDLSRFVRNWNRVCAESAASGPPRQTAVAGRSAGARAAGPRRARSRPLKILLAYVSYPVTTARYLESSLRKQHQVLTLGPAIGPAVVRHWNLEALPEPIRPHDIPCGTSVDLEAVIARLGSTWTPDLFLWVESVPGFLPLNVARVPCPTACYLIDSHLNLERDVSWASRFDWTFVAQRQYVAALRRAGCNRVAWLPLACDPAIHGRVDAAEVHDIAFVGSVNQERRRLLLERLARRFGLHMERSFLHLMARTFSSSKIVFNNAAHHDLNMRVFEALASGSLLLTDRADGSGLEDLFEDGRHLALYDDDEMEERAAYYLEHDAKRRRIGQTGRAEVLRWHTYDHRAADLVGAVFGDPEPARGLEDLGDLDDPLLIEALHAAAAGRAADALDRLAQIGAGREMDGVGRVQAGCLAASCLEALGRRDEAEAERLRAFRDLPPAARDEALDRLSAW